MKYVIETNDHRQNVNPHAELLQEAIQHFEHDNMDVAIAQFLALAAQDCEDALLYLSLIYRDGDGTEKDELQAARYKKRYVQCIEAKASAGHADYQLKLAYLLQFGDGVAVDNARAFQLFLGLAQTGMGEAQFHLSRIYAHGRCGQKADVDLELFWLKKATEAEWPKAIYYSALFLEPTATTAESRARVVEMMQRSAALGCWQAKDFLDKKASD